MNEHNLAERFSRDVDRILRGGEVEAKPVDPVSEEYNKVVELARSLAKTDFSDEWRGQQALERRLLDVFRAFGPGRTRKINNLFTELDDDELDHVAGGVGKDCQEFCALCNCKRSARTIQGDTCPDCGHPRECHSL